MTGLADAVNGIMRRVPAWALYVIGPLPALWFLWLGLTGGLGPEPIKALEQQLGELALQLLLAGLAITPLRRYAGVNLIRYRRAIGLLAFSYVMLHLAVWLFLDVQIWSQILADIAKRPYITIGMAGFALLIPLAVTSNNWSVRRLGPAWRRLHRLTYPAVLLGAVHYVMLVKGWQIEPLVYLSAVLTLLALRLPPRRRRAALS
ncbi:MAG: protein-methionine-sulfoxide reductase heme-binding subunit MsrQ [Paracoccaceae bacterium]